MVWCVCVSCLGRFSPIFPVLIFYPSWLLFRLDASHPHLSSASRVHHVLPIYTATTSVLLVLDTCYYYVFYPHFICLPSPSFLCTPYLFISSSLHLIMVNGQQRSRTHMSKRTDTQDTEYKIRFQPMIADVILTTSPKPSTLCTRTIPAFDCTAQATAPAVAKSLSSALVSRPA